MDYLVITAASAETAIVSPDSRMLKNDYGIRGTASSLSLHSGNAMASTPHQRTIIHDKPATRLRTLKSTQEHRDTLERIAKVFNISE